MPGSQAEAAIGQTVATAAKNRMNLDAGRFKVP